MIVIPQELEIKNFMSIKNAHLFFENKEKLIFITGENGEGKTTVLEALNICLSGDKREQATYGDYVNRSAIQAEILFKGLVDDTPLVVEIILTSKGKDITVTFGDLIKTNTAADELLEEIGLKKFCKYSFYMQDTQDILRLTPTELSEHIRGVLSLDTEALMLKADKKQEEVEAQLQEAIKFENYQKGVIQGLEVSIEDTQNKILNANIGDKQEKIKTLTESLTLLNTDLLNQDENINLQKVKIQEAEIILNNLRNNLSSLQSNSVSLIEQKSGIQEEASNLEKKKLEFTSISKNLEDTKKQWGDTKVQIDEIILDKDSKEKELKTLKENLENKRKEKEGQEKNLETYQNGVLVLTTQRDTINENIIKLGTGICPTCGKNCSHEDMSSLEKERDILGERILKGRDYVSKTEKVVTDLKQEIKTLDVKVYDLESNITSDKLSIQSLEKETTRLEERLNQLKVKSSEDIKNEIINLDNKLQELNQRSLDIVNNIEGNKADVEKKNIEISNATSNIGTLKGELKSMEDFKETLNNKKSGIEKDITDIQNEISSFHAYTVSLEQAKENLEKSKIELKKAEKNVSLLNDKKALWKKIRTKTLKDFQTYINLKAVSFIEEQLNDVIKELFDYIKVRLEPKGKGVTIKFTDERDNEGVPEDKVKWTSGIMASRMQNQAINVAFLILFQKLYNNNLLLMDESDSHASYERSKKLFNYFGRCEDLTHVFAISQKIRRIEGNKTVEMALDYGKSLFLAEAGSIRELA